MLPTARSLDRQTVLVLAEHSARVQKRALVTLMASDSTASVWKAFDSKATESKVMAFPSSMAVRNTAASIPEGNTDRLL